LHGDGPRPSFSIYAMKSDLKTTVKGVDLIGTQPNKQANQIHWSPQGKYLVLGGLKVRLHKHCQAQLRFAMVVLLFGAEFLSCLTC